METITFYSYKGGVGRTLALKNYAIFLANYGFNVCVLDFDLEAPGLHYKFRKYIDANQIRTQKGLVDIIFDYQENRNIPDDFLDYTISLKLENKSTDVGTITLLSAGDSMSVEYWKKLTTINWQTLLYSRESAGDLFFLELKERIRKSIKPDFLLIDSRTGITEVGGLCTSTLPDKVVFLICNNDENKEGARLILRTLQDLKRPWADPVVVFLVLSRFPSPKDTNNREELLDRETLFSGITNFINEPITENSKPIIDHIIVIDSDRDLERSETSVTDVEPLYTKLFLDISPKSVTDKIAAGLKDWSK